MVTKQASKNFNFYGILWKGLLFLLLTIIIFRLSVIGQGIDDLFRFIFGWNKYFVYFLILFFYFHKIFKWEVIEKAWQKRRKNIGKKEIIKVIWLIVNIYWIFGLIGAVVITTADQQWEVYSNYGVHILIPNFVKNWKESYIFDYQIKNFEDFFLWHKNFSTAADSGGIIGITIASFSAYTFIIGGFLLNLISIFLMISYFLHNKVFYYFLSQQKKEKIKWMNLNAQKKYQVKTNVIDEIEDQDITIEMQTAKKMEIEEKKQQQKNDKFSQEHQNFLENIKQESVKEDEIILDDEESKKAELQQEEEESED